LAIPGRGIEISEGGMALYAGLPLKPGDFMDIEFQTAGGARITAVVRNRTGFCYGLEFLTPLGADPKPAHSRTGHDLSAAGGTG
ncbi:MAG: PilZ domain-containing protein, partial [Acidobacteriota bacterium]|nr:PilZ domain-containing protein [Acidobacteriota bacterium]